MNIQTIILDLSKQTGGDNVVTLGQGDKSGTTIRAEIYDNGAAVKLDGCTVEFMARLPDKTHYVRLPAKATGNVITYVVDEDKVASVAGYTDEAYFFITQGATKYSTERFALDILRSPLDGVPAHSWDDLVEDLINKSNAATAAANAAAKSATSAATSATAAAKSANEAAKAAEKAAADAEAAAKKIYYEYDEAGILTLVDAEG